MDQRFLGSFLSRGLRTNQLELNTDEKTLRPIARLKEPRDLFALPKDKEHDCPQQAPRWPIECQVIEERIIHIPYAPTTPEPYNQPTGSELKPRPVGEENGLVVFNYNPISAVNYDEKKSKKLGGDSSDSDISSDDESRASSPDRGKIEAKGSFSKLLKALDQRSSSNSNDECDEIQRLVGGCDKIDVSCKNDNNNNKNNNNNGNGNIHINSNTKNNNNTKNTSNLKSTANKELWAEQVELAKMARLNAVSPVRVDEAIMARLHLSTNTHRTYSSSSISSDASDAFESSNKKENHNEIRIDGGDDTMDNCSNDGDKTLRPEPNLCTNINNSNLTNPGDFLEGTISESSKKSLLDIININLNRLDLTEAKLLTTMTSMTTTTTSTPNDIFVNQEFKHNHNDDSTSHSDPLLPQFSRSAVGGSKFLTNCHPYNPDDYDGLEFESRFESGNLAKAVQITPTYYELYLRSDLYTSRSKQWFYFRVKRTKKDLVYRFSIVNLVKADSLYNEGMRPLLYSTINAKQIHEGWRRCGSNVCYYRNDDESSTDDDEDNSTYTLTFNVEFPHDNDTVFLAHSYPYTYSELQDYLMDIQKHPIKSKFCKLRLLCRSLAGNNVYYLTVTAPTSDEDALRRKKSIVVSARVHPSETPSSWMMKGLMDFITGDTMVAKRLRHKFIFKLIPMLNPDGVIVGNTRNSLTGKDLNRQYRTVIRETYPSIWYTKAMIKRLIDECGVAMYCDMHAHSRKHNIFIYGCENKRNPEKKLTEQVFPLMMHKNVADKFSFEGCKFKIQRSKEGTGRIVVWMLGITNSYTIEASFGGSSLGSRKGTHFSTADYEHMGRAFCETLLDYCDENPNKVKRNVKLLKQIKKIRKREKAERKALKLKRLAEQERLRLKIIERLLKEGSSADEPLNIPLSDYSSDEGGNSSSSDNEGKGSISFSDLEGPCCAPTKAPPCSPEINPQTRRFKYRRMRKIMHELDRIYFQPLFQKKFRMFMRRKQKSRKQRKNIRTTLSDDLETNRDDSTNSEPSKDDEKDPEKFDKEDKPRDDSTSESAPKKGATHKKTKRRHTSHDNTGAPTDKVGRIKVSRKLRLWLAKRRIIIFRHKKQIRKVKVRTKSMKSNRQQRQALDMPTTDPGGQFSTDDESYAENANAGLDLYGAMPRPRRILLQSELQRRYIEEIGDGIQRRMPPELIITSPSKTTTLHVEEQFLNRLSSTAPVKDQTLEFPMISGPSRRTYSWHNLSSSGKPAQKTRPNLTSQSNPYNNNEDLQFRLSLKKKIWKGVQPDISTTNDYPRPLSWIMPSLTSHSKKEKSTTTSARHGHKKDDKEAFVNACSQKLLAWQQSSSSTSVLLPKKKLTLNLLNAQTDEEKPFRLFKHLSVKSKQKSITKLDTTDSNPRKERTSLSKIAETTQIVTRLTKATKARNALTRNRQLYKSVTPTQSYHMLNAPKSPMQKNKFKTGGIVATAVQPMTAKKTKKLRVLSTSNSKFLRQEMAAKQTMELPCNPVFGSSTFVGKVKAKIKKKKTTKALSSSDGGEFTATTEILSQRLLELGVPAKSQAKKGHRLI